MDGILIKFGKKINISGLADGKMWFSFLSEFRDIEIEQCKKGQGDNKEGVLAIRNFILKFEGSDYHPVYCMTHLPQEFLKVSDNEIEFTLPADLIESMGEDFDADSMFVIEDMKSFINNLEESFNEKLEYKDVCYEDIERRLVRLISDEEISKMGINKENLVIEPQSISIIDYATGNVKMIPLHDYSKKLIKERLTTIKESGAGKNIGKSNVEELHFSKELFFKPQREFRIVDFGKTIDNPQIIKLKSSVQGYLIDFYKNVRSYRISL